MKCEECGKEFDIERESEEFETETLKNYNYLTKTLCSSCAISDIRNLESGIYYEYCERCGKKYDPIVDNSTFESKFVNEYGSYASIEDLTDELLCLDCALDEYNKEEWSE